MSSGPDLYLVCKSCGAEVSPYITECPYCGTRIQKRAPKLDRGGVPKAPRRAALAAPAAAACARARSPASAPTAARGPRGCSSSRRCWSRRRSKSGLLALDDLALGAGRPTSRGARSRRCSPTSRPATRSSPLGAIALFGWLLERRHGWWAPLLVFLLARRRRRVRWRSRPATRDLALGANGAALGAARARGRCATCSAAATASRTTATCSACWRSPPCSSCCRSPPPRRAASPASSAA